MLPKLEVKNIMNSIKKVLGHEVNATFETDSLEIPKFYRQDLLQAKDSFHINEFLNYHDEDFVRNAYRGILRRNPDREGFEYYISSLRNGSLNKIEILGRIKHSKEAKRYNVQVTGLTVPFAFNVLYKIPLLGYLMKWFVTIAKLPRIIKKIHQNEMYVNYRFSEQAKALDQTFETIGSAFINHNYKDILLKLEQLETALKEVVPNNLLDQFNSINAEMMNQTNRIENLKGELLNVKNETINFNDQINYLKDKLQSLKDKLQNYSKEVEIRFENIEEDKRVHLHRFESSISQCINQLESLTEQTKNHKLNIVEMQRRLSLFLEETRKRFPEPLNNEQIDVLLKEQNHFMDALYVTFEDQFRGTREDIMKRLEVYLPYVNQVKEFTGDNRVIDLGCGRGEWIELLTNNNFNVRGADLNRVMVDQCQERGFDVQYSDAVDFLKRQKSNSVAVVSGFHIIEHIPLSALLQLFDESLRVLKPGGMVLFETPNPESIWVGAYTFRTDPTHINPLVPDTVRFLVEQRGFIKPEILRLHKRNEPEYTGQKYVDEIIYKFNMEQDYSVIAYKA